MSNSSYSIPHANIQSGDIQPQADLSKANLEDADLKDAYFFGADLSDAYLSDTNLRVTDFSGAVI